ncbi:hypothetical protein FQZ97_1132230 [compost metagenome]
MAQALAQQAGGHARYAAVQVVETLAAAQQLAHYQRRPALAQRLGGACDRTELPVAVIHPELPLLQHLGLESPDSTLQILD